MTQSSRSLAVSLSTILVLVAGTLAVWLHNRDILRDLFDYATVIAAGGKIEAGLKPYADVRSPIQSGLYLLNYLTEQVFGRSYLALTWGGLVQALGGGLLVRGLLSRRLRPVGATIVALAVVGAGLLQHLVFFYNPVGLLCLAVVLFGLAEEPALWPVRSWPTVAIWGALFLGGINKLNFQGATLVLGGLLTMTAASSGRIAGRTAATNLVLLALGGLMLPLAFELLWTGASLRQWWHDVVQLPAARRAYVGEAAGWEMYVRPVHDFHHHLLVRPIGGIGLILLLATGGWLLHDARTRGRPATDQLMRVALVAAGAAMGALLMITNHETVLLTSLAYPVVALAIYLNLPDGTIGSDRWMRRCLIAGASIWLVAGFYAAWHGSRLLYGPNPPPRSDYVRFHAQTPALTFFDGVRMLPAQIDANERAAAKLRAMEDSDGRLRGVVFAAGLEWLERGYPDTIVRGAPMFYHAGTTLHQGDAAYLRQVLANGASALFVQRSWQSWPPDIQQFLAEDYRAESPSGRDVLYHPRGRPAPATAAADAAALPADVFRDATAGNVLVNSTRYSAGLGLQNGPAGEIFGATRATNWAWPFGTYDATGQAVARLQPGAKTGGVVTFRALAGDSERGELLWEIRVAVDPGRPEIVVPVTLQPGGRPVWLQTAPADDAADRVVGGWRAWRITRTNPQDRTPPPPFGRGLVQVWPAASEAVVDQLWYARTGAALGPDGAAPLPAENWRRDTMQSGKLSITAEFTPDPASPGDHVVMTLAWYRGSRFEIMTEKEIDLQQTRRLTLEAYVPEPGGWVGLLTRTGSARHTVRVTRWER